MTLSALIFAAGFLGLLLLVTALKRLLRGRIIGALLRAIIALVFLSFAAAALLLGGEVQTYRGLSAEQAAGEIQFARAGSRQFNGVLTYPTGERATFVLRGDEWQIDARILKWRTFANLLGFDAAYRLERISGRYGRIEEERTQPRTVYSLHPPDRPDLWELLRRYNSWLPGVDALYGSAAYLPMADGARYEIKASQSGLLARPLNPEAKEAVGTWH